MGAIETYLEVPVHDTLLMTRLGCCGRRVAVISRARAVTNRIPSETNAQNPISKATHVHRCRVCIAFDPCSLSPLGAHLAQAHGSTVVSHVRSVDLRAIRSLERNLREGAHALKLGTSVARSNRIATVSLASPAVPPRSSLSPVPDRSSMPHPLTASPAANQRVQACSQRH